MKNIKILSTYHKAATIIPSEIIIPFWVGKGNVFDEMILSEKDREFLEKNTLFGDTGDNIADFAHMYGELASIYWASKNMEKLGNPDYIGFTHYRRHFDFSYKKQGLKIIDSFSMFHRLDSRYIEQCHLDDPSIREVIEGYDAILPLPASLSGETVIEQYKQNHRIDEFYSNLPEDVLGQTVKYVIETEKNPQIKKIAQDFLSNKEIFLCNMFIMKKDIFLKYAEWIFRIVFDMQKRFHLSKDFDPSLRSAKILGFVAERLTGLYMKFLSKDSSLKVKYLPQTFLHNTDIPEDDNIKPAFQKNNIPICFSFSGDSTAIPLLLVALKSIINNASKENSYDIMVFGERYSEFQRISLESMFKDLVGNKDHIKIRLFELYTIFNEEVINSLHNIKKSSTYTQNGYIRDFSIHSLFRVFLPTVLQNYEKAVYLDVDVLIYKDIAELYRIDLNGKSLGISPDITFLNFCFHKKDLLHWYEKNIHTRKYYNAGVLVMNLKKMRENSILRDIDFLLEDFIKGEYPYGDQDFLNNHFQNDILAIPLKWNWRDIRPHISDIYNYLPHPLLVEYKDAIENPSIVHFFGVNRKPWHESVSQIKATYDWWKIERTIDYPRIPISVQHHHYSTSTKAIIKALEESFYKTFGQNGKITKISRLFYKTVKFPLKKGAKVLRRFKKK